MGTKIYDKAKNNGVRVTADLIIWEFGGIQESGKYKRHIYKTITCDGYMYNNWVYFDNGERRKVGGRNLFNTIYLK